MLSAFLCVVGGWVVGIGTIVLYIRGRLTERWYVTQKVKKNGYQIILKKGQEEIVCFRVLFDRKSSPNPDSSFEDQLAQARAEAYTRAEAMNGHEYLTRGNNRKHGTPGGLT